MNEKSPKSVFDLGLFINRVSGWLLFELVLIIVR